MGVAIRALSGVERDYNAHMVRMILRDIFDHSGNITQRTTNQKSESQISGRLVHRRFATRCCFSRSYSPR